MKKKILWSALALFLVAVVVVTGGGWYFSDQIKAGTIKVDHSQRPPDLEVTNVSGAQITLEVMPGIKTREWNTEGIWGVEWKGGYGQVGKIVDLKDTSVVREFVPIEGVLSTGEEVRLDSFAFPGDPLQAHGIAFKEVYYSSNLGSFPAWYIEGSGNIWVIFIHGHGASRREALRILPALKEVGLPTLVITYRNDEGVPQNPDGLEWFGLTEWEDLEGAVNYAIGQGAQGVVLIGYSMGGAISINFLYKSPLAEKVKGVVLDSPMLDLGASVDLGASQRTLPMLGTPIPRPIIWAAKTLSSIRFGINYSKLDYIAQTDKLAVPILLFQSDGDRTVPPGPADTLAKKRADIVQYVHNSGIDHVRTWNVLRSEYENIVKAFLSGLTQK